MDNPNKGRRDFLKYFFTGSVLGFISIIFYPLISYLKPPEQSEVKVSSVSAGKTSELKAGTSKIIRFGNIPVIVIHTSQNKIKAFSATCTHLDCTVQYKNEMGVIWCACHNGKYNLNGKNISGPPPKPLTEFRVVIKNDEIFVSEIS